jgi:nucleoside-diphosphate-sugar epimerase
MRVLVTGSSAHLARALLPRLLADPRIRQVTGVDLRPGDFSHPNFTPVQLDVRDPALAAHLAGIDALVHLAFVVMQGDLKMRRQDRAYIRDVNVNGSQAVFTLAARAGVKTLIHLSSAAVYALPLRQAPATETHPRAALPGFAYAEDKIAVETWLEDFEREHAELRVVRLRPHVILGPRAQPFLRALLRAPVYPRLPSPAPLTQCVHEDDVAQAIERALFAPVRGAFNLACADAVSFRDLQRKVHGWALPLPLALVRGAFYAAWRYAGYGTDPAWLAGMPHTLTLDTTRARTELQWRPRHPTIDACLKAL